MKKNSSNADANRAAEARIESFLMAGALYAMEQMLLLNNEGGDGAPAAAKDTGEMRASPRFSVNAPVSGQGDPNDTAVVTRSEFRRAVQAAAPRLGDVLYWSWQAEHSNIIEGGRRMGANGMIGSEQNPNGWVGPAMEVIPRRLSRWKWRQGAAGLLMAAIACGAEAQSVAGISASAFGAKAWREPVANAATLPACGASSSGHLRYAVTEAALYRCNGSAWVVAITGADTTCNSGGVTCLFAGSASEGGPATTALALATDPAACTSGRYVSDISAAGALTCSTPAGGGAAPFDVLSLPGVRLWFRATNAADDSSGEMAAHGDLVRQVTDASGNRSPLSQGSMSVQPDMVGNATPSGRAALELDERSPWMASARPWSAMGSASELLIVAVFKATSIARNSATPYSNDALVVDGGSYLGLYLKDPGGAPRVVAYNWDGSADAVEATIALNTWHVVVWRHSGGTLGVSVDGGAEVSVASGGTSDLAGLLRIGAPSVSFRGYLAEVIVLATAQDVSALVTYLRSYYGI